MAATLIEKQRTWKMHTDADGYRIYDVVWLVDTNGENDGPAIVYQCSGLPRPGQVWDFDGDVDVFARCLPEMSCVIHEEKEGESGSIWRVEQQFSSKLFGPAVPSGTFQKYSKEARTDNTGRFLKTSSWEQLKGPQVEFDHNHPAVRIEQDVMDLELPLLSQMVNSVNSVPMWGLPKRCVKFSDATWSRKILYANATATASMLVTTEADPENYINETQTLSIFGLPTGGGFTLMVNGISTEILPFNADDSTVQTALENLYGVGNVSCGGGDLPAFPITIEFIGALSGLDVPLITVIPSLIGGNGNYTIYYYNRVLEFDIDFETFDKFVPDEGTKVLRGKWEDKTKSSESIGSGCRVIIEAAQAGGALTGVKLAEDPRHAGQRLRGQGYPPSSSIKLKLLGGGGSGGLLYATTDVNGRIDTIRVQQSGDTGYPFGLGSGYSTSGLYEFPFGSNATTSEGIRRQTLATVQVTETCQITITTISGNASTPSPIKTITLVTGGSGYPANTKIRLSVGGTDSESQNQDVAHADPTRPNRTASVIATVGSTGVVTSVVLEDPGEGFIPTAAAETGYTANTWKLEPIGGRLPDPNNPQHFIKYTDRQGNPSRTPLNGAGIPANSIMFDNKSFRLSGDPAYILVRKYKEFNFPSKLQLPVSF